MTTPRNMIESREWRYFSNDIEYMRNAYAGHDDDMVWLRPGPDYRTGEPTHVVIPETWWGDYCGSTYTRANYVWLMEQFGEDVEIIEYAEMFHSRCLVVSLDAQLPEYMSDVIAGLMEYPVIDDGDTLSTIESEIISDDLESWLLADIRAMMPEHVQDEMDAERFYAAMEDRSVFPSFECATSSYWSKDDMEAIARSATREIERDLAQSSVRHTRYVAPTGGVEYGNYWSDGPIDARYRDVQWLTIGGNMLALVGIPRGSAPNTLPVEIALCPSSRAIRKIDGEWQTYDPHLSRESLQSL